MRKIIFFFLVIFQFSSCIYPDGPQVSISSQKNRLVGKWLVTEIKINDQILGVGNAVNLKLTCNTGALIPYVDSSSFINAEMEFKDPESYSFSYTQVGRSIDIAFSKVRCQAIYANLNTRINIQGKWRKGESRDEIEVSTTTNGVEVHKIKRLTQSEFIFEKTINGDKWEMSLIKIGE